MGCEAEPRTCPYFNVNDPLCGERFTLERMTEVFEYCLGRPEGCQIYQELRQSRDIVLSLPLARAG